jgi:hypothetical protein
LGFEFWVSGFEFPRVPRLGTIGHDWARLGTIGHDLVQFGTNAGKWGVLRVWSFRFFGKDLPGSCVLLGAFFIFFTRIYSDLLGFTRIWSEWLKK